MKQTLIKPLKIGVALFATFTIALAGCSGKPVDQATQEEKQTPVKVVNVENSSLKIDTEIVGTMKADVNVAIMPKLSGELVALNVEKGDQVDKGQVLGKIDDRDLQTTLQLQQAALQAQQAALEIAKASEKAAKTTVTAGDSALNAALINWQNAQKDLERTKALYEDGAVSKVEYEAAITREQNSRLQYEQAKIDIEKAEIGVESSQAQLKQTELSVKQAQDRLKDATIKATQAGEVVEVNAKVGDTVGPQSPLFTIVSLDPMIIESTVSAGQLSLFKEGMKVNIDVPVLNKKFIGEVSFISPVANQSGLYVVEAKIENKNKEIKPGMIGKFVIDQTLVEKAIIVPTSSIVEQGGVSKIFIVEDGKAVEKEIEIIQSQTDFTAIKGDVKANDQVVYKGQLTLVDGNLVKIIEEDN
ncbi:efflux RND transporter periplasmic adaptor subunit [Calidifontibacillus oryziterrae]|uniref:efflux RND transporter periplasmic adaptor subunit n=1 Tax=Calidifontibacillus oryziterrae TaxID=1191699 RepID=UPI0002F42D1A|nr:efflux RND transporter periplasmic adaptor subunit [Calidifontibacillus oryziterrae]